MGLSTVYATLNTMVERGLLRPLAFENAVRFDNAVRMDQTRIATMMVRGRVTLRPLTTVRCEKDRIEEGDPIRFEVL